MTEKQLELLFNIIMSYKDNHYVMKHCCIILGFTFSPHKVFVEVPEGVLGLIDLLFFSFF